MRPLQLVLATVFFLLFIVQTATAQTGLPVKEIEILRMFQFFGVFCIGWGVGVTGWLVTGHQAMACLFVDMPRAWKLWQKNVLTSSLPIYKYLIGGGLLLVLGTVLVDQLWGLWFQAFDAGIMAGFVVGAGHSLVNLHEMGSQIDFLEANQRYLNKQRVSLFTEYERP